MDELLNRIARNLKIRVQVEKEVDSAFGCSFPLRIFTNKYKEVSDEVRKQFRDELERDMCKRIDKGKIYEEIYYISNLRYVEELKRIIGQIDDNFSKVFMKLPKLKDNEEYMIDGNICIVIIIEEINEDGKKISVHDLTPF